MKLECSVRFEIQYGEWLALYRIPTGILHAWNHYTKLSMLFQAQELCMVSLEKNILTSAVTAEHQESSETRSIIFTLQLHYSVRKMRGWNFVCLPSPSIILTLSAYSLACISNIFMELLTRILGFVDAILAKPYL